MIYSQACAYAIRGLTHLAAVRPEGYMLVDDLCEAGNLPRHFVAKIFQDLVRKGILLSAKGRGGGFALAKPAGELFLYDIVAAIDGTDRFTTCVVGMTTCDEEQACAQHEVWCGIRTEIVEFLQTTSLEKMAKTLKHKLEDTGGELPKPSSTSKPLVRD